MELNYQEAKPSAALQSYVDCYWLQTFTGAGKSEQVSPVQRCVPFGMVEFIVHLDDVCSEVFFGGTWYKLPKLFLAGLYRDPVLWRARGNSRKFGIQMKPETMDLFFKLPAGVLYSDYTAFENVDVKEAALLAEKLSEAATFEEVIAKTEAYLLTLLFRNRQQSNYIIEAAKLIRCSKGSITVEELSRSVSVSPRQLQRSFREKFGTSPKTYSRMIRFSNAYMQLQRLPETGGWAGLSYTFGYTDQTHFIKEFKEFSGMIPNVMLHNSNRVNRKISLAL